MDTLLRALKASAESTRLRILLALAQSELTVTELVNLLGQSQPRVSRHLKLMVEAGLLDRYQEGAWVFHRITDRHPQRALAETLIENVDHSDDTLIQDQTRLKAIKQANADRAARYFSQHAGDWDRLREYTGSADEIESALLDALPQTSFEQMVDMGTGTGRLLELFAPYIRQGIGFDLSHEMLNVARARLDAPELAHCQVRQADIRQLPSSDASADLVSIHQVLHYLDDPASVIGEAARILAPHGHLFIIDFAKHDDESLRTEHAHRRLGFDDQEITDWCERHRLNLTNTHIIGTANADSALTIKLWLAHRANTPS